jgi:Phage minor structural protein GP20
MPPKTQDPIGYFQGRPVYESEGGVLNAGPSGTASSAGGSGGSSGSDDVTETDESSEDTGSGAGGAGSAGSESGSTEGSTSSEGMDGSSSDAEGGKQGQGQGDGKSDAELAGLKSALAKERETRKARDKELAELRKQHASAEERLVIEAKETAAAEAEERVKRPLIKALAAAELRAANVQGSTSRLVGLLDLDKVSLDDDNEPVGLTEQIDQLREEFPNLFAAASSNGSRPKAGNVNGGSGSGSGRTQDKGGSGKPKPWFEQLADQVLNPGSGPGVAMK